MGFSEFFVYSKNNRKNVEKLAEKLEKNIDDLYDAAIICKGNVISDIHVSSMVLFGTYIELDKPIEISKGTEGIFISVERKSVDGLFSTLDKLLYQINFIPVAELLTSPQITSYNSVFKDSPLIVNGKMYSVPNIAFDLDKKDIFTREEVEHWTTKTLTDIAEQRDIDDLDSFPKEECIDEVWNALHARTDYFEIEEEQKPMLVSAYAEDNINKKLEHDLELTL